jgi:hypothetical protein
MDAVTKDRKQVLQDIDNAARTLTEDQQRDLNARLRELQGFIAKLRQETDRGRGSKR